MDAQVSGEAETQDKQVEGGNEPDEDTRAAETAPEGLDDGGENSTMEGPQNSSFPNAFGFGGMNGQFPNMNFGGGDFSQMNQMQMMMAMQNGMAPSGFGFPMMGRFLASLLPMLCSR